MASTTSLPTDPKADIAEGSEEEEKSTKTRKADVAQMPLAEMDTDSFSKHPITQKEATVWEERGWTLEGYERGSGMEDTCVTVKCTKGHCKTMNVQWYLTRPFEGENTFKCIFCEDPDNCCQELLEFKRLDYVHFYPNPDYDSITVKLGRVFKINRKSICVMTADGKQHNVKSVKTMKPAPTPAVEISVLKRKKSEMDKLK